MHFSVAQLLVPLVIQALHTTKIMSLCADQKFYDLSLLETTNNFTEISRSVFLYTNCSTRTKINILKKIFEQCDVEQSELSFLIKKDSNV